MTFIIYSYTFYGRVDLIFAYKTTQNAGEIEALPGPREPAKPCQ